MRFAAITLLVLAGLAATASGAQAVVVADAGALRADVSFSPWSLKLVDGDGGFPRGGRV